MKLHLVLLLLLANWYYLCDATLYPKSTPTRDVKPLDGVWNFRVIPMGVDQNLGFSQKWYQQPLRSTGEVIPMPVPSSFNDIVQDRYIMDYWGWAWYDHHFYSPLRWHDDKRRILLRLDSVRHDAIVYLNGVNIVNHTGGELPFEVEVTNSLKPNDLNLITVAANNVLTEESIPQGSIRYETDTNRYPKGFSTTEQHFDFFNYGGIERPVRLYSVPETYIDDITIVTSFSGSTGIINFDVSYNGPTQIASIKVMVEVFDANNVLVANQTSSLVNKIEIKNAVLWWPYTMNEVVGYQYTLRFSLINDNKVLDSYHLKTGIRTVRVTETSYLINEKPFYFRGFGKHEDFNIHGKGLDIPLIIKDFNLIKWFGANSFRTSHYPYSEEMMDQADAQGIVVIDETPATGLNSFKDVLLNKHKKVLKELISRDKNRPSVMQWSMANEPITDLAGADTYFKSLIEYGKSLDPTRPFSVTTWKDYNTDTVAKYMDVVMIQHYYGWYIDKGYLGAIGKGLTLDLENWIKTYPKKPIIASEYGADTSVGLHDTPAHLYSEDYQAAVIMEYFKVFDNLKKNYPNFIGEMIWNFADFKCSRALNENWGIMTRERKPKAAAKVVRCRYWRLAGMLQNATDNEFFCPPT